MTDIIVLAGSKQSGKSSAANFITGYVLTQIGKRNPGLPCPTKFDINEKGELIVNAEFVTKDGEVIINNGILDLNRRDYNFAMYAEQYIWPYIKSYAFADTLKDIGMHLFDLTYEQCYGSDEEKNTLTNILWSDMKVLLTTKEKLNVTNNVQTNPKMTAREFFQYFGTQVCRQLNDDCWVSSTFKRINAERPSIAIITDCRFPNEVDYCINNGAKIIKLERKPFESKHDSETGLENVPKDYFNLIIPSEVSLVEKNQLILDYLYKEGILKGHV